MTGDGHSDTSHASQRNYSIAVDLAWAAGFFDGEGSTVYCLRRPGVGQSRSLSVTIAQVQHQHLSRFATAVGVGKIRGPYRPKYQNGKPYFVYSANGIEAVRGIQASIGPFLCDEKIRPMANAIAAWDAYVPAYKQCRHSEAVQKCHICRVERAHKAWATRRSVPKPERV